MPKILIPLDGSEVSQRVAATVAQRAAWYKTPPEIHLLNVQRPVHRDVGQFVDHDELQKYHRNEGLKALDAARAGLARAGLAPVLHVLLDDQPAAAIAHFARERGFDEVYLGNHAHGALSSILLDSVAADLIRRLDVPVTLIK